MSRKSSRCWTFQRDRLEDIILGRRLLQHDLLYNGFER